MVADRAMVEANLPTGVVKLLDVRESPGVPVRQPLWRIVVCVFSGSIGIEVIDFEPVQDCRFGAKDAVEQITLQVWQVVGPIELSEVVDHRTRGVSSSHGPVRTAPAVRKAVGLGRLQTTVNDDLIADPQVAAVIPGFIPLFQEIARRGRRRNETVRRPDVCGQDTLSVGIH